MDPDVRSAFDRALAMATAVRSGNAGIAVHVLDGAGRDELVHVALALAMFTRKAFDEWCADMGLDGQADGMWARWAMSCQRQWDGPS